MSDAHDLLTIAEASAQSGWSAVWLQKLCREGRMPGAFKRAEVWFIPTASLLAMPVRRSVRGRRRTVPD